MKTLSFEIAQFIPLLNEKSCSVEWKLNQSDLDILRELVAYAIRKKNTHLLLIPDSKTRKAKKGTHEKTN